MEDARYVDGPHPRPSRFFGFGQFGQGAGLKRLGESACVTKEVGVQ